MGDPGAAVGGPGAGSGTRDVVAVQGNRQRCRTTGIQIDTLVERK